MVKTLRNLGKQSLAGILVVYALYHGIISVKSAMHEYRERTIPDSVTAVEQRFRPLALQISGQRYRLGYVTNMNESMDWPGEFLRIQYTLAPLVIEDSMNAPVVVANIKDSRPVRALIPDPGPFTVVDCGNGVLLLSRKSH